MRWQMFMVTILMVYPSMAWAAKYEGMVPGKWETQATATIEGVEGMPAVPPQVKVACITQEQLDSQEESVRKFSGAEKSQCIVHQLQVSDQRSSWDMECNQNGQMMRVSGEIVPDATKKGYTGSVRLALNAIASLPPLVTRVVLKGTWLGACDADTPMLEDAVRKAAPSVVPGVAPATPSEVSPAQVAPSPAATLPVSN